MTLMEVLIAVTLVGLLMVAVSTSLSIGIRAMERSGGRIELNRRILRTQEILELQIRHLVPAQAACTLENPQSPNVIPFFQGEPLAMRFISTYSLREGDRGYPKIIELTAIPGDPSKQPPGLRLIVNELPYMGPLSAGRLCFGQRFDRALGRPVSVFLPVRPQPTSFVLADRLQQIQFRYLEQRQRPQPPLWVPRWGLSEYPTAIAVDLIPLPDETAGVQPASLVLPVQVNRRPGKRYED
jgi:type II secretory pathway pseudopilin PulG